MKSMVLIKKNTDKSGTVFTIINTVILFVSSIIYLYPFYYIFIYSISNPTKAQSGVTLFPRGFTLDTYLRVFLLNGLYNATIISILRTVIGTVITVFCCSLFAYFMTIEKYPFRKYLYRFIVITMYFNAGLIPWYVLMKFLHFNDSFLLYILPSAMNAFFVILIKTFIEQLPKSLEESAKLDGAGYLTIFFKIIFPISTAIIATIAVFAAVNQWNTWFDNYLLVNNRRLYVLQYLLYNLLEESSNIARSTNELNRGELATKMTPESIKMTITMVVTLPILFVYPFAQRYFTKGIIMGAIKG